ncbi:MAG TPA: translation initiation factor IF-2 [Candidatus Binataceae bacterium]|nr:translation initiation factor IF-2 [Candidatus Binataceae bacterium]
MARKRIKTLAHDWGFPVEEVLASCERLKLPHALSESVLLSAEETSRVRADLDEQAHRAVVMRRETTLETSAGKVVEKRLNATVMRRRHAEPAPGAAPVEPFHFEMESPEPVEQTFSGPIFDEPLKVEPRLPELQIIEPTFVPPAATAPATPSIPPAASPEVELPRAAVNGAAAKHIAEAHAEPRPTALTQTAPPVAAAPPVAEPPEVIQAQPAEQIQPADQIQPLAALSPVTKTGAPTRVAPANLPGATVVRRQFEPGRTVNLTNRAHTAAPSMDEGQAGPKVLGKIDLRKPATTKPAPPTGVRPGGPPRPGMPPRPGAPSRPGAPARPGERRIGTLAPTPGPENFGPPPSPDSAKPGARTIKKKKVVKRGTPDIAAEREMRGLRVPRKRRAMPGKELHKTEITTPRASKRIVRITEGVTVGDLAHNMGVKAAEIIKQLMGLGVMSTLNQVLDVDTATLVAGEFGYSVENVAFDAESEIEEDLGAVTTGESVTRPPVVTVMGHVDHGKTSLLDAIRHTNVTEREFGGITQHIGAYMVEVHGRKISFVDTPGHEAFTAMRARGAKVTDIVVLVVAADEGVMPQTIEALNHAKAAGVPVIVAINKIDRPEANIDRVKQQLTEQGLIPEDYGGETITVPVSARSGEGVEKLLEMILLQADVMELKANPDRSARGAVVESQIDRGRGPVATVLIQEGTLHTGDAFVCGTSYGRVRAMQNHLGERVADAGPSTPVEVFGLSSVPEPGTAFTVVAEESKARQVAEFRRSKLRDVGLQKTSRVSLETLSERLQAGEVKELRVIVKGDVNGSVEALADWLQRLSTGEVKLELLHKSVGAISETDVTLASASRAIILGFNVRPEPKAAQLAEKAGVDIRLYTIIYDVLNDIREAMEGLLAPTYREKALGRAEIRQTFMIQSNTIGGAMVTEGKLLRGARSRLVRDGRVVWEGKIASLRRFKDDAREVLSGYECGVGLENFNDLKPGDVVEDFEMEAVLRKLGAPRAEAQRGAGGAAEKQPQP